MWQALCYAIKVMILIVLSRDYFIIYSRKTTNNLDPLICGFFQLRARTTGRSFLKTYNQADFPQAGFATRCRPHF